MSHALPPPGGETLSTRPPAEPRGTNGPEGPGGEGGAVAASRPPSSRRVGSLDVLRGIAILGTLASNIWIFTGGGLGDGDGEINGIDAAALGLVGVFVDGRFLALLSILFGVGMAIQFEAAARRRQRWPFRYLWRSLILLLDGFVHYVLVFEFDVLMGYALISAIVAPLLLLSRRWLIVVTVVLAVVHLAAELTRSLGGSSTERFSSSRNPADGDRAIDGAFREPLTGIDLAVGDGSYFAQVGERLDFFWEGRFEAFVVMPPLTGFLMLVGVGLWRAGVFRDTERAHRMQRRLAAWCLGVSLPLSLVFPVGALFDDAALALAGGEGGVVAVFGALGRYVIAPVMAFGYLGLVLILVRRFGVGWWGRRLEDVGRTALSCYVLQNLVASVAFYRWGLGLAPLGTVGTLAGWFVISALLTLLAHLWLRRFRTGPFEIAWRYLVDRPFRARDRRAAVDRPTAATAAAS